MADDAGSHKNKSIFFFFLKLEIVDLNSGREQTEKKYFVNVSLFNGLGSDGKVLSFLQPGY